MEKSPRTESAADGRISDILARVLLRGYQLEREAVEWLSQIDDPEVVERMSAAIFRHLDASVHEQVVIGRGLLEKIAEEAGLSHYLISAPKSAGPSRRPFASDVEARVEIVRDPTTQPGGEATQGDYANYFRSRFVKLRRIFSERLDCRDAGTVGEALTAPEGQQVKLIGMVFSKRLVGGRFLIRIEDVEDTATVLIGEGGAREALEVAGRIVPDQVICVV